MSAVDQTELTPTRPEEIRDGPISPLLVSESGSDNEFNGMTRSQAFNLYTSHFLSTWNVRTYEFAAVSALPRYAPRTSSHSN
jgi:iron-regulated transporter 1